MRYDEGPIEGDAFGTMLLAALATPPDEPVVEVIERSDGYIGTGDARRYFALEARGVLEAWLLDHLGGRVLDIGAGAGRVSLVLQERGEAPLALDTSPGAVEVCQRRGVRETFHGTVYDLAYQRPGLRFDGFALFGNNLGLFASAEEAPRFLRCLAAMAGPGAIIASTGLDPYQTTIPELLAYHEANRAAGSMGGQIRFRARHRRLAEPWFDYLLCSLDELRGLLAGTGWELAEARSEPFAGGLAYAALLRLQ